MKAVILAGGIGSRLSEETQVRPKPLVEIGGKPILWHIMKICAAHNITDFVICCGYKGHLIKDYFATTSCMRPTAASTCGRTGWTCSAVARRTGLSPSSTPARPQ